MSGNRIEGNRQGIEDVATFISGNIRLFNNRLNIQPLVRLIYNSRYDAPIVQGVNFKVDMADNFNFRGGLSTDFRAPGLKELYLDFVDQNHFVIGNQDLRAENSYSINGALNYTFATSGNIFKGELKSSYNVQNDMISLAQNGFNVPTQQLIYTYVNIDEFRSQANEIGFSYLRDDFTVNFASTYIGRYSSIAQEFLYSNEFTANVIYNFRELDLNIAALYKFTGRLRSFGLASGSQIGDDGVVDPEDLFEFEIPGFHNLDLTFTKTFWQDRIELTGGIKNFFDVTNLETERPQGGVHSGGNTIPINWGRTFFGGINFNLR
jgi:outer membrane receptor for ferrienterochelin and colicins